VKAEAQKSARSTNSDAIDLTMLGRALLNRSMQRPTKGPNTAARALFEQALEIDPNNADALTGNAYTYFREYIFGWGSSDTDYDAKVLGQVDRAIALAPDCVWAFYTKSFYLGMSRRLNDAIRVADAGLAINPNYAPLYVTRHGAEMSLGRYEQAKSDIQQAIRLNPRDPNVAILLMLGDLDLVTGNIEAAIDQYRKAYDAGYRGYFLDASLAAAYALEGKMDEAKSALAEARRLNPNLTIKWFKEHAEDLPIRSEGLRKAGLPEE
jgi:tetratricopeptide (TPR) repeat protein